MSAQGFKRIYEEKKKKIEKPMRKTLSPSPMAQPGAPRATMHLLFLVIRLTQEGNYYGERSKRLCLFGSREPSPIVFIWIFLSIVFCFSRGFSSSLVPLDLRSNATKLVFFFSYIHTPAQKPP